MIPASLARLGKWSAVAVAVFSLGFSVSGLLGATGLLRFPIDPVVPHASSLLLAVAFVVMMICVHCSADAARRHWSAVGAAFAIWYAVLVSIVYFVSVTVVVPYLDRGEEAKVAPFVFDEAGSYMQALDGIGYFLMGLATLFTAWVYERHGPQRWLFRLYLVNGVLAIPILLAYMPLVISWSGALLPLGALWIMSLPALAVVTAVSFSRQAATAEGAGTLTN